MLVLCGLPTSVSYFNFDKEIEHQHYAVFPESGVASELWS